MFEELRLVLVGTGKLTDKKRHVGSWIFRSTVDGALDKRCPRLVRRATILHQ
jgi:hypothetical protein